jgi:sec-independent protein translocase protein TatB
MIEIDFGKLILLALVALIVLGPEKLPGAARTAGALLRRLRSGWDNVRAEVERELEIEEIRRAAREAAAQAESAQTQLDSAIRQVHDPLAQAAAKTSERYRLTETPSTAGPSSTTTEDVVSPAEGSVRDSAKLEQKQGDGRPLDPVFSTEKSLGEAGVGRGEPLTSDSRFLPPEIPTTGQLFEDAPVPTEPPAAVTRNSAHGGH